MSDTRIDDIEFRLAHVERSIEDLSTVMYRQQQVLDELTGQLRALRKKLQAAVDGSEDGPQDETPPHY